MGDGVVRRVLGKSGIEVSAVGMGCMGLTHASGDPLPREQAARVVREAFEMGCTFFDTAECCVGTYPDGSIAFNEEAVGDALRPVRDEVVIATKFGVRHNPDLTLSIDSRPETIRRSVDGSLERLGVDCIDLYYQHRIDPEVEPEEVAGTVAELIAAGKVRAWGISEATEDCLRRADAVCPVAAVQNRYSMLARWNESLLPCSTSSTWRSWPSAPWQTGSSRARTRPRRSSRARRTIARACRSTRPRATSAAGQDREGRLADGVRGPRVSHRGHPHGRRGHDLWHRRRDEQRRRHHQRGHQAEERHGGSFHSFAVLDPAHALTAPMKQALSGAFDMLSHSMETYFGAPHDNNLSDLIAEANMRCIIDNARKMIATPEKFARFATEVWGIDALEAFIAEIGLPGTLSEMGISGEGADEMLRAVADSTIIIPTCPKVLDADEVFEILEAVK